MCSSDLQSTDAPVAALLDDLNQRGLLDDTLVVWGGEFGRPGLTPGDGKDQTGHSHRAFTFWLAGGGVKAGLTHGKTNDTGAECVAGKVHFRDLHATIFTAMGISPKTAFDVENRPFYATEDGKGRAVEALFGA